MKALIKKNRDKGLWLEEVPAPKTGVHDILIRVLRTSLGGTDLSIYLSSEEYITLPASAVWVHSPGVDLDIAVLFESLGDVVYTALQCDLLGKSVLITGTSSESLMAAAVCSHLGARLRHGL